MYKNAITVKEMFSLYGNVSLWFSLYHCGNFLFKGESKKGYTILLMINVGYVQEISPGVSVKLKQFKGLIDDTVNSKFIKIKVLKDDAPIFSI